MMDKLDCLLFKQASSVQYSIIFLTVSSLFKLSS
jgi:hypothetical protein